MKKIKIIIVILLVAIIAVGGVLIIPKIGKESSKKEDEKNKVEHEIKDYGYVLLENETKLYKDYFKELLDVLNKEELDDNLYAQLVVKLFISDFYDLNSKSTKNDVGGLQFVYDKVHENFVINAKDTIYKYVENNLSGDRTQKLPSVSSVTTEETQTVSYTYNNDKITDEKAYKVKATWEYVEDLGYQKEATFTLMHLDKKLVIVEIN